MRVALVHDWITGLRGGERVLLDFLSIYPNADIYTLVHVKGTTAKIIDDHVVQTSFLNKIPNISNNYKKLLPFFPLAVKSLKIQNYDLVISTSHAAVKNIKTNSLHVSYCFSPIRYIWDQSDIYLGWKKYLAYPLLACLRYWDKTSSNNVNQFVGISNFIKARIRCFYNREAEVIYPAVNIDWIYPKQSEDYFIFAGALVPYKLPDLVIKVFNKLNLKLKVVGSGALLTKLKSLANDNIEFISNASDQELAEIYSKARALIVPGIEDFGLIPVEMMGAGKPVITYCKGGTSETVIGWKYWINSPEWDKLTGVYIKEYNSEDSLKEAIEKFIENESCFDSRVIRNRAEEFSLNRFKLEWLNFIENYVKTKK